MHLNKNTDLKTKVHFIVSFTHQALKTVADPQENVFCSEEHHYGGGGGRGKHPEMLPYSSNKRISELPKGSLSLIPKVTMTHGINLHGTK